MKNAIQEETKPRRDILTFFGFGVALLGAVMIVWQGHNAIQASKESFKVGFREEIVRDIFFAADVNTSAITKEIKCSGSEKRGVTCEAIGDEVHTIKFSSTVPMADFKIQAVRDNNNIDIRQASGLPLDQDSPDVASILKVFKNPISSVRQQ